MKFSNFFQHQKTKHVMKHSGLMIGVLLLAVFFAQGLWQLYGKMASLQEEQKKKEQELAALMKERKRLESEIEYLQSTNALEREAKARLNYKKTGEEVVIVVPEAEDTKTIETIPEPIFWKKIWGKITSFFR